MFTVTTIRERVERAGRVFEVVQRQPSWVARLALRAMFLVFFAVVFLLVVPALLVGVLVFFVAAAAARVAGLFGRSASSAAPPDARENVRVIPPSDR